MHFLFKSIRMTRWFYSFVSKRCFILCKHFDYSSTSSTAAWSSKYHPLLWHILTPATLTLAGLTPLTGCFAVVLTLCSHPGWEKTTTTKTKQLASVLLLVVELLCSHCFCSWRRLSVSWKSLILLHHQECYGSLQLLKHKPREGLKKTLTKELIKSQQALPEGVYEIARHVYILNYLSTCFLQVELFVLFLFMFRFCSDSIFLWRPWTHLL